MRKKNQSQRRKKKNEEKRVNRSHYNCGKQQAQVEQETAKVQAETALIKAQNEADIKLTEAKAEAEANQLKSSSLTPELIQMTEAEARLKHGWVTVQGADTTVVDAGEK